MTKRSQKIRSEIGNLIYEMQLFQTEGNDHMVARMDSLIEKKRIQLEKIIKEEALKDEGHAPQE